MAYMRQVGLFLLLLFFLHTFFFLHVLNLFNLEVVLGAQIFFFWAVVTQAFDQQQEDLVVAASKALSYRQEIIEENIRLTYALQVLSSCIFGTL